MITIKMNKIIKEVTGMVKAVEIVEVDKELIIRIQLSEVPNGLADIAGKVVIIKKGK